MIIKDVLEPLRKFFVFSAGAIVGAKFYFSFTPSSNFNEIFDSLKKEIGDRGKLVRSCCFVLRLSNPKLCLCKVTEQ